MASNVVGDAFRSDEDTAGVGDKDVLNGAAGEFTAAEFGNRLDARLTEFAGMRTSSREWGPPGVGNQGGQAVKEVVRCRSGLKRQRWSEPSNRNKSVGFGDWEIGAGREVCELRQLGASCRPTDWPSAAPKSSHPGRLEC